MRKQHKRSGTLGRIVENAIWLLAGKGLGGVLSLVYLGIATRSLGPDGFGQFVLILGTAQAIATLVTFQTWQIVVRFGMPHLEDHSNGRLARLIAFCAALDFGAALIGCLIAFAGTMLLGPIFGWSDTTIRGALAFSIVVLLAVRSTPVGILRLHDRFGLGAAADAVMPVARMIGALAVLLTTPSVEGFLIAWACAEVATALTCWLLALRVMSRGNARPLLRGLFRVPAENPGLLHFAFITNAGSTLGGVSKQFAVLLVGIFAGPAAAGSFRLAHQIGQALARVSEMLSRAIFSELNRVHSGGVQADLARLFRRTSWMTLILGVAMILILLLLGKPILGLIGGSYYLSAYPLLLMLGVATALEVAGVSYEPALMTTGHAGKALRIRIFVTLTLAAALALLLPIHAEAGAAAAMLGASALGLLLFGGAAWREVRRLPAKQTA